MMDGCDRLLIATDNVTNACTNFTNVVIRIMREDERKGGCDTSKMLSVSVITLGVCNIRGCYSMLRVVKSCETYLSRDPSRGR